MAASSRGRVPSYVWLYNCNTPNNNNEMHLQRYVYCSRRDGFSKCFLTSSHRKIFFPA